MGGCTKIRANHGWPSPCVRQSIKRDVSDAGEERIRHFGQNRTLHSSMERNEAISWLSDAGPASSRARPRQNYSLWGTLLADVHPIQLRGLKALDRSLLSAAIAHPTVHYPPLGHWSDLCLVGYRH
jgi:hypothetical protein